MAKKFSISKESELSIQALSEAREMFRNDELDVNQVKQHINLANAMSKALKANVEIEKLKQV